MARGDIERKWLSVAEAGKYVGISSSLIRRAIELGELPAYRKPVTYSSNGKHNFYKISTDDIDAWIRSCWEKA